VDLFTGTLGKALGGAAGGFVAGPQRAIDLLVQRGRPTLFSNALPVSVACSAQKAIQIMLREPQRVQRLRDNVAYARTKIGAAGSGAGRISACDASMVGFLSSVLQARHVRGGAHRSWPSTRAEASPDALDDARS